VNVFGHLRVVAPQPSPVLKDFCQEIFGPVPRVAPSQELNRLALVFSVQLGLRVWERKALVSTPKALHAPCAES
jgi:hypothetical protein